MNLAIWLLATLAAYRLWRFVALDDLPPWRDLVDRLEFALESRVGDRWAAGLACPWCSGWWATVAVFTALDAVTVVPLPLLQVAAASTVVGWLGAQDA